MKDNNNISMQEYIEALMEVERRSINQRFIDADKAVFAALRAQEKLVSSAMTASDKATAVAKADSDEWRRSANEWRGTLADWDNRLATVQSVEAMDARLDVVTEMFGRVHSRLDTIAGERTGQRTTIAYIVMAISVVATILTIIGSVIAAK